MNVFELRERVIGEYAEYVRSFVEIRDSAIRRTVEAELDAGLVWPEPYIGLNPAFESGAWIDDLVREGVLHPECARTRKVLASRYGSTDIRRTPSGSRGRVAAT